MAARSCAALFVLVLACGESSSTESSSTDPRFATPERTVATLLAAHGVDDRTTAEELAAQLVGDGLPLLDRASHEACFVDLDQPGGAGMADYVLGMLAAAGPRDVRYQLFEDHAYVSPREGVRIVMRRGADGAYRIVLAESVPEEIRASVQAIGP